LNTNLSSRLSSASVSVGHQAARRHRNGRPISGGISRLGLIELRRNRYRKDGPSAAPAVLLGAPLSFETRGHCAFDLLQVEGFGICGGGMAERPRWRRADVNRIYATRGNNPRHFWSAEMSMEMAHPGQDPRGAPALTRCGRFSIAPPMAAGPIGIRSLRIRKGPGRKARFA
jgi:hypothetical protein